MTKKQGASSRSKTSEPSLNMDELHELANLVEQHGFTDFEFENANIRVRLSKNPAPQIFQAAQTYAPAATPDAQGKTETATETTTAETATDEDLHKITSPIVGTFYRSPSPDKDPYVKEGSNVSPDTIVCIVEAMKLMNEIEAEVSGEVVKIYVENGQPVEYGQPLFGIRK
ncbi:MAG: acetyl-CoA carboxylase biotin carboxyl carrier protein [Acidobacteriota bacterium]|nr:acetyl-CoA carboxylase biotin carboxyl carrier protein [Acidobacteriota bacterium]